MRCSQCLFLFILTRRHKKYKHKDLKANSETSRKQIQELSLQICTDRYYCNKLSATLNHHWPAVAAEQRVGAVLQHWGSQNLFRKPAGIPSRFPEGVKWERSSIQWPAQWSGLVHQPRASAAGRCLQQWLMASSPVTVSGCPCHTLGTLIKACHVCFPLQTKAALGQDRWSFRQHFF